MRLNPNLSSVAVVGAGPAGLMVALIAARSGARVLVCEQLSEPGTRLLATGGGHCNFTNTLLTTDCLGRFGRKRRFVTPAIKALNGVRLRQFFEELGIPSHSPDGFHVLPVSGSAHTVRDALFRACRQLGVKFRFNSPVISLPIINGHSTGILTAKGIESAACVVLATGGASCPDLGGGESGFRLAKLAGHTIVTPCPALVPMITRETWPATLAGVSLPRVTINMVLQNKICGMAEGGLLFTHKGISGPATLDISGQFATALLTRDAVAMIIDFVPGLTPDAWQKDIARLQKAQGARTVQSILAAHLPAALAKIALARADVPPATCVARLSRRQSHGLFMLIKHAPLTITGTEGFAKAMVTSGGISLDEICPRTMESKLVRGLYFAGEILDVDGPCGGFNLQWAFSSGFLAARNLKNQQPLPAPPQDAQH